MLWGLSDFISLVEICFNNTSLKKHHFFFLKDKSKYAPISTNYFDKSFEKLGIDLRTSRRCSWDNYLSFNETIRNIQHLLVSKMSSSVTFIDAHSFVWMLTTYPGIETVKADIIESFQSLPSEKSKEIVIQARIGQGKFREKLLNYWNNSCSVTHFSVPSLLIASHIKPWVESNPEEAISAYNGLLLTPNLDKAFDLGLISFSDEGKILLSSAIKETDLEELGITKDQTLKKIETHHNHFLAYHRENIFKS